MPLPTGPTKIYLPLLSKIRGGREWNIKDVIAHLAKKFNLSEEELELQYEISGELVFKTRVYSAIGFLRIAALLEYTERKIIKITEAGEKTLQDPPDIINHPFLMDNCPPYKLYQKEVARRSKKKRATEPQEEISENADIIPEEQIENIQSQSNTDLEIKFLEKLLEIKPVEFERLIIKLFDAMGYTGLDGEGRHLGGPDDQGVDGVLSKDVLGVDRVYFQAKRYAKDNPTQPNAIQSFNGALDGKRAQNGIFITTSYFTKAARDRARNSTKHIVLIDGDELTSLMRLYNVGCQIKTNYEVKEIDEDFFDNL